MTIDGSPLDPIRADLEAIGDWLMIDGWSPDQTRAQLAALAAICTRLEGLSDAPDVADTDYDGLSMQIGELEIAIAGLPPADSEVTI